MCESQVGCTSDDKMTAFMGNLSAEHASRQSSGPDCPNNPGHRRHPHHNTLPMIDLFQVTDHS